MYNRCSFTAPWQSHACMLCQRCACWLSVGQRGAKGRPCEAAVNVALRPNSGVDITLSVSLEEVNNKDAVELPSWSPYHRRRLKHWCKLPRTRQLKDKCECKAFFKKLPINLFPIVPKTLISFWEGVYQHQVDVYMTLYNSSRLIEAKGEDTCSGLLVLHVSEDGSQIPAFKKIHR